MAKADLLRGRLLHDLAELQRAPYPGITLHLRDRNTLKEACLILTPPDQRPLHMTIRFGDSYPIQPPKVTMQSYINHPNVFQRYICASILNTTEGYTPAYTLKGICIQLLSFFGSDSLEQDYGATVDLKQFRNEELIDPYVCGNCRFGKRDDIDKYHAVRPFVSAHHGLNDSNGIGASQPSHNPISKVSNPNDNVPVTASQQTISVTDLPNDILLLICDYLGDEDLAVAFRAWNGFKRLVQTHQLITIRELQCFTLKKGFKECQLGIGVRVNKSISSEFDLVSKQAFHQLGVRRSVQGLPFSHWLPLPLSTAHWHKVSDQADAALLSIGYAAHILAPTPVTVLQHFLNSVVVTLSTAASSSGSANGYTDLLNPTPRAISTLIRASEKAMVSYYQLVHLLFCIASEHTSEVEKANRRLESFMAGNTDKNAVPNLGRFIVSLLLCDPASVTEDVIRAIIQEAITRNVVSVLDRRGDNRPELSFLEASDESQYRVQQTFQASLTSYRLLMFQNLMRRSIVATDSRQPSIQELRDDLFARHGCPPEGAAARLAEEVRRIQQVETFPQFLRQMGLTVMPTKAAFSGFLRRTICESVEKGYSRWAFTQPEALLLRIKKDPAVVVPKGLVVTADEAKLFAPRSFFPKAGEDSSEEASEARRGRGRGPGRGHGESRGRGGRGRVGGPSG